MTDMEDGFYWVVRALQPPGDSERPFIAQMEGGRWFLAGYEGPDEPDMYRPISPRLDPGEAKAVVEATTMIQATLSDLVGQAITPELQEEVARRIMALAEKRA